MLDEPFNIENNERQKNFACNLKSRQEASNDGNLFLKEEKVSTKHLHEEKPATLQLCDGFDVALEFSGTKLKGQEVEVEGIDRSIASERHVSPPEVSPARMPTKRKISVEKRASESCSSKQHSSKKLEVDNIFKGNEVQEICKVDEVQEISDSATSRKKCNGLRSSVVEKHQDVTPNPLLGRSASKLVAYRSSVGSSSFKKTTVFPSLQTPRSSLGSPEYHSITQRTLVDGRSSSTRLQNTLASQKKPALLGGLQSPLPAVLQPNTSSFQVKLQQNPTKDASSRILQIRSRPSTEKQQQGVALRRTSGLAVLSKTRVMGALRESCEKTFRLDCATSKGTPGLGLPHSRKNLDSFKIVGNRDENHVLENRDTEMVDVQNIELLEKTSLEEIVQANAAESPMADVQNVETMEIPNKEIVQAKPHLAMSVESDAGIIEKAEHYADRLDQLLKELKIKYEEAMDLRVRAMVVNNSFMMLNNPVDDEKIRKITQYVREKLCPDVQHPSLIQPS
ncbi:hypothetical protein L7F22_047141 [Adiantum nelumboides]|nr:hypothetical protein [Adiantum nelumboides]